MKITRISLFLTFLLSFIYMSPLNAQNNAGASQSLDAREQSLVTISTLTAIGDLTKLKSALQSGLDAGLTINETKEALVQLYAYCGFPRSLNGLNTLITVLGERKAAGTTDVTGKEAAPIANTATKYETGRRTLETLTKTPHKGPAVGVNGFAPIIDTFLKEHLFADIFSRDILTYTQRELITISALASMRGLQSQLQAHIGMGMNVGLTEAQLSQAFSILEKSVGQQEADTAKQVLATVVAGRRK